MPECLDVSIIIINWHSARFVLQCVQSIRRQENGLACEIIVFDNGSFDGCEKLLRERGERVIYLQSSENIGFAKANNLAFKVSQADAVLFLNPDTKISGPAISRLHHALCQLRDAGAVGPKLLNGDGSAQTSCIQSFPTILNQVLDFDFLRRKTPLSSLWGMAPLYTAKNSAAEVDLVSGACLMVKRNSFQEVGRFSEDYFMYGEDADLCFKLRENGWKTYYVPGATVIHYGGCSSRKAINGFSSVMTREAIRSFFRRWRGERYGNCYRWAMFAAAVARIGLLGILFPIQIALSGRECSIASFRKWWAILLWSLRGHAESVRSG